MKDTIAVAFIAVAGTLGSGILSYFASRASTKAQLESVRLDILKLTKSQDEEARQERVTVYFEYLSAAENLERFYRGLRGATTSEFYKETFNDFTRIYNRLLLIGNEPPVEAAEKLQAVVGEVTRLIVEIGEQHPDKSPSEKYSMAIEKKSSDWKAATRELQAAMRRDTKRPTG